MKTTSNSRTGRRLALSLLGWLAILYCACAAPFAGKFRFTQPDATVIELFGRGDEFHAVFETLDGYTVVFDADAGAYCYARLRADGSELVPTNLRVGTGDPATLGVSKHLRLSPEAVRQLVAERRQEWEESMGITRRWNELKSYARLKEAGRLPKAPPSFTTTGPKVGLCLLIDFDDEPATIPESQIEQFCNSDHYTGFGNNGSVKQYFKDVSNGTLIYSNIVTAYIRITQHPKSYYNNSAKDAGEQGNYLIRDAISVLKALPNYTSEILPALEGLTTTDDNEILAVNVFYAGDNGGVWSRGLWPHAWRLQVVGPQELSPGGKRIDRYQISNIGDELELGTFCHENGHMLCGFPDVYDYDYDASGGAGEFCLMNSGGDGPNPSQVCAYLKTAAGWATLKDLTSDSSELATLTAGTNRFYRYRRPGVPTEYFLIENRQQTGRDAELPGSGLAIWHVDELGDRDNQSLLTNHFHQNYEVTLVQADNQWHLQNNVNDGDEHDLYYVDNTAPSYVNRFSDRTSPSAQWWDGTPSGVLFHDFSTNGTTMTFLVNQSAPVVTTAPSGQRVDEGATVTFRATVEGSAPLTFRWHHNGVLLRHENRPTLTLSDVKVTQQGEYSVVVSNPYGSIASAGATLTVNRAVPLAAALESPGLFWRSDGGTRWRGQPIVSHDGDDAAQSGVLGDSQTAWMEATVLGPGTLSFWWKVSSEPQFDRLEFLIGDVLQAQISGEVNWTNCVFNVPSGLQTLRWQYMKDGLGSAGADAGWVDQVSYVADDAHPPVIVAGPASQSVREGDSVTFSVTPAGTAPFSFQWFFQGVPLSDATGATLVLNSVVPGQSGLYSVAVQNALGEALSAEAALRVVPEGSALADDFEPDLDRPQWLEWGGVLVATNHGGSVSGANALWFGGDGSRYVMTRSIDLRSGGTVRFHLRISDGDHLFWEAAEPQDGIVFEYSLDDGSSWTILNQYAPAEYGLWREEILQVPPEAQSRNVLFRWRQLDHSGACCDNWALDDVAISPTPAPPAILAQPADAAATIGSPVAFHVVASGQGPLSYQWQFDGSALIGATEDVLEIGNVLAHHAGHYRVVVGNAFGSVTSQVGVLTAAPNNLRIAIWGADSDVNNADVRAKITGTGFLEAAQVDVFSAKDGAPPPALSQLLQYDAVLVYSDAPFTDATAFGNVLADYFDQGGGAVLAGAAFDSGAAGLGGRVVQSGLLPVIPGPIAIASHLELIKDQPAHPLLNDVTELEGGTQSRHLEVTLAAGALSIAQWSNGRPLTAVRESGNRRLVALNFFPPSSDVTGSGWPAGTDGGRLLANALLWAAKSDQSGRPPEIVEQPQRQTIPAGATTTLTVAAQGEPPLHYEWRFNGTPLSGATNGTLVLNAVRSGQMGAYSVRVSNARGSAMSSEALVLVLAAGSHVFDDFEPDVDHPQWSAIAEGTAATNLAGSVSGAHALWFDGAGVRLATTRPVDTTLGGFIRFCLRMADGYAAPWESPDLGEGVALEYSVDAGADWRQIALYEPHDFSAWTCEELPIPSGAEATNAWFRWRQLAHSGAGNDHWALDDVTIAARGGLPPFISGVDSFTNFLNQPVPLISFTVSDAESPVETLLVTALSSNPDLVPNSNLSLLGVGTNRMLSIQPQTNALGSTIITLRVTDEDGRFAETDFEMVVASVPPQRIEFLVGSVTGNRTERVIVPIQVRRFTNISSVQFSFHWDADLASFVGVTNFGLPDLSVVNIGDIYQKNGTLLVSWDDSNGRSASLSNDAVLFSLEFELPGNVTGSGGLTINGLPAEFEVLNEDLQLVLTTVHDGVLRVQNPKGGGGGGGGGECGCVDNCVEISGMVSFFNPEIPLPGAMLQVAGATPQQATTGADGLYRFDVAAETNHIVTPSRVPDGLPVDGITMSDVSLIRRYILGIDGFEPKQVLAADANDSGGITTADLVLIRRLVLDLIENLPSEPWKFIPPFLSYENLMIDSTNENFLGVKVGDVNGSWTPPASPSPVTAADGGTPGLASASGMVALPPVMFEVGQATAASGETVEVPVVLAGFTNVSSLQGSLRWDTNVLQYVGVEDFGLPGLGSANFNTQIGVRGQLAFGWDDPIGGTVSRADGTVLFSLRFQVFGGAGARSPLAFSDSPTLREVGGPAGLMNFVGRDGEVRVAGAPSAEVSAKAVRAANGTVELSAAVPAGRSVTVQASSNLADWTDLVTTVTSDGVVRFTDPATNRTHRFYRLRLEP